MMTGQVLSAQGGQDNLIDHVNIRVSDLSLSRAFYERARTRRRSTLLAANIESISEAF